MFFLFGVFSMLAIRIFGGEKIPLFFYILSPIIGLPILILLSFENLIEILPSRFTDVLLREI